jgi:tetratricopeptide (TPR) repeat protein
MATLTKRFGSTFEYALSFLATIAMTSAVTEEAGAKTFDETLLEIENRWAEATYETKGRERNDALEALLNDVRAFAERHPDRPEAAAWHGVIARECIKNRGRSRSTKLRREAREALLKAESLDPLVLDGLVYANLGALYSQTHSNYLYAELLVSEKRFEEARQILQRAAAIPARPDHLHADRGRREQILNLLESVDRELEKST